MSGTPSAAWLADNMELFGYRAVVTDNIIEDGQDEGIVLQGYSTLNPGIKNPHPGQPVPPQRHQRPDGPAASRLRDRTQPVRRQLLGPQLREQTWASFRSKTQSTDHCHRGPVVADLGASALKVRSACRSAAPTALVNSCPGSPTTATRSWAVWIRASTVPAGATDILDVGVTVAHQGTTNGQRIRVKGTGAPTVLASPGSQFLRTDGSNGTTLYVKETGNDGTGWTVMGATVTPSVQLATATGSYTWTKPAGAQVVDVILCAAGGGGASGAIAITGNAGGGGGGGGGALAVRSFAAADLPGSVTGSVGTGGNGGSAASGTGAASGSNGVGGGTTTFGAFAFAGGGNVGAQGTTTGGAGGAATDSGTSRGGTGGAGGTGVAGVSSAAWGAATGGGGGGGATTAAGFNGGTGQFSGMGGAGNTGTAGVAGGASPGTGTQPAVKGTPSCGGGGGAGANGASPTAQTGATAFFGGGGGGGGGAFIASGTGTSGAGGKGGDGFALIVTHFA